MMMGAVAMRGAGVEISPHFRKASFESVLALTCHVRYSLHGGLFVRDCPTLVRAVVPELSSRMAAKSNFNLTSTSHKKLVSRGGLTLESRAGNDGSYSDPLTRRRYMKAGN